eukprot:765958-Hanusia_phi.AAC.3
MKSETSFKDLPRTLSVAGKPGQSEVPKWVGYSSITRGGVVYLVVPSEFRAVAGLYGGVTGYEST